jgi:fructosamine-3-kinase
VPGFTKRISHGPDYFAIEAAGLRWLADAGPDSARVVQVLAVDDHHIELELLQLARATRAAAEDFGRALAVTHSSGADAFGQPPPGVGSTGYIGRQRMAMEPTPHWGQFYAQQRMLAYARPARDLGTLSPRGAQLVDRVAERLEAGDFDDGRPPARIHGDLWSGNVIFTGGGVVMIDPAAHGGHGLTDLAMLQLFGAPYLETITAAYAEAAQLDHDWPDLIGLHQLHPLLVHAITHGAAYGAEAERIAARYV